MKSQWWHVCKILSEGEQMVLEPLQRHAARQWALDALLLLYRDQPQAGPYCLVETNREPSWDWASYGPRQDLVRP
jgi:hypothetical protein